MQPGCCHGGFDRGDSWPRDQITEWASQPVCLAFHYVKTAILDIKTDPLVNTQKSTHRFFLFENVHNLSSTNQDVLKAGTDTPSRPLTLMVACSEVSPNEVGNCKQRAVAISKVPEPLLCMSAGFLRFLSHQ